MKFDETVEQTALTLGVSYGRCPECGHVQRDPLAPCEEGCELGPVVAVAGKGIPRPRAIVKAEATAIGKLGAKVGFTLMVLPLVVMALLGAVDRLTMIAAVLLGVFVVFGFAVFSVSLPLISRDASPGIAAVGEWIVKLARAVRGRSGR